MSFLKSATSEGLADADGVPHREYGNYYAALAAERELAVIVTGHIAVSREGRAEPRQVFVTGGEHYPCRLRCRNLQLAAARVHAANPDVKFLAQLSHGGRQIPRVQLLRNGTRNVISPAPGAVRGALLMFAAPNRTPAQAKYVRDQFLQAFEQMLQCGFDGAQLHCAHGYLLHDCLRFGMEDFVQELVAEVVQRRDQLAPAALVSVKAPAEERFLPFLRWACRTVDVVELTKGDYERPQELADNQRTKPAFAFAEAHPELRGLGARLVCTGGFASREEARQYLLQQQCHLVGLARVFCLPGVARVERVRFAPAVEWLGRRLPLCCAGPATVFYEECIRRRARGVAGTLEQELRRATTLWWLATLLLYALGMQRYCTRRDLGRQ